MSNIPFRVMRGEENVILNKPFNDGCIYFTTDSKRIYLDVITNGEQKNKLPVGGGNSGIYYASKTFEDSADISFSIDDIEGNELPGIGDLIINYNSDNEIRDGFYKVITVETANNSVTTTYLPVGGGGSGSGGTTSGGKILITPITPTTGITTKEKGYVIKYSLEVYNNNNIAVDNKVGRATFNINGKKVDGGEVKHGGTYSFDITDHLDSIKDTNVITLSININTGGAVNDIQTFMWTVKCVDLRLNWNWNYSPNNYINADTFTISFTPYGGVDCKAHIIVDDRPEEGTYYFTRDIKAIETGDSFSVTLNSFNYGAHKISIYLTTNIGEELITSDTVSHMLTFIKGGTLPILTVPFFKENATQYDTLNIPFLIYDPIAEKINISFYVDDINVKNEEYEVASTHNWPYTLGTSGQVKLKIACTKNANVSHTIDLQVIPLSLDIVEPVAAKAFSLKASTFSGNSELQNWKDNNVKLDFSENFDWKNGGLQFEEDDEGNITKYICVRQGTKMYIDYNLFDSTSVSNTGKTFKFCFKATNCYNYDAPVLTCYEEATKIGLKYNAQAATFSWGENIFTTQYCEGQYIELEIEIWPDQADITNRPGDRFIMFWVDGVPAGVKVFDHGTLIKHNNSHRIEIGSDECDVYVYVAKAYERQLNATEHLNNFILDAPNGKEILARYTRNDILNTVGEVSYEKLVKNNPGCRAYLYDLPEGMTKNKEDKKPCDYSEYYLNADTPVLTADAAKMFVQGTSSAAYGVAAYNIRTDFRDTTMYDAFGRELEGRKVSDTSVPVKYTCTKVNVASCENANNALNAEWYNKFQPYWDGHRRKSTNTKQYRDCMEFDFGVMFVRDHNPNKDYYTDGKPDETKYTSINVFAKDNYGNTDNNYVAAPYYRQYAISNMGNDKKNIEVFHDIYNPKACCVEVLDNQNAEHWMTVYNDKAFQEIDNGNGTTTGPFYEFRYSVEDCEGENPESITVAAQEKAFLDFVKWMSECNPNGATNNSIIDLPVEQRTFEPYTFKGFNPPGYEEEENPTGISLKGVTISTYATDKQLDTKGKWIYDNEGRIVKSDTPVPYTHDTYEYRMAKMLKECEEYLIMDSVVFHYLYIERHTMVDNVAKNTFWSTEDGKHWDLTKNYDNDTSDGNDNSGYLTYTYGNEIGDTKGSGASIFNAMDSVWINFIKGISDAQEALYTQLSSKDAWDAEAYANLFDEKQSLIPERCWIEDYFRKYIRPRRIGLDGSSKFLQRLEGGKKTHQRRQFETYHGYYMDSKYCAGNAFQQTGSFDLRMNSGQSADFNETTVIPVSYYIDLYPSGLFGGQEWRSGERLPRGTEINVPIGKIITNANDGTCYFYATTMIQTMKGISAVYPTYVAPASAIKLKELEIGSDAEGYYNANLTTAKLDENTQLIRAQLQQVGAQGLASLDLSKLKMLRELKIDGSTVPSLTLADGGIINTLWLNPLGTLKARNLTELIDFQYDQEIKDSLIGLLVQNCPILNDFSYMIAKEGTALANYCFNDINWIVPESDWIGDNKIAVLENLLTKGYLEVTTSNLALTGLIDVIIPQGQMLDEYEVYQKYIQKYPNLAITYSGNTSGITRAHQIIYYNDVTFDKETMTVTKFGDSIYSVKAKQNGTTSLGILTSAVGPAGAAIETPTKDSDKIYDYSWSNEWYVIKDNKIIDTITNDNMKTIVPSEDMIFAAKFDPELHLYKITLRDYDGSNIKHNISDSAHGTNITDIMPYYLYRPHNIQGMRYEFQGWISARDHLSGTQSPTIIEDFVVEGDTIYYAFYEEQNCLTKASNPKYFRFSADGKAINLSEKYRFLIQEPITLPLYSDINKTIGITAIGDFGVSNYNQGNEKIKIPEIYFENNGVGGYYSEIHDYAFWSADQGQESQARVLLKSISLPNTLKKVGSYAFIGCTSLEDIELPDTSQDGNGLLEIGTYAFNSTGKVQIDGTGLSKLTSIGTSAFYRAGDGVVLNSIPENLHSISGWAFGHCGNVSVGNFEHVNTVGADAFNGCGKYKTINIVLPTSLIGYSKGCFTNYATGNLGTVTYNGNGDIDEIIKYLWGKESTFDPTTIEQVVE